MKRERTRHGVAVAAIFVVLLTMMTLQGSLGHAATATYHLVENWAQLPPGTRWSQAMSIAIDSHGTVYLPRREFLAASRSLRRGQVIPIDELLRAWLKLGYDSVNTVIAPGQYARRGGILDVWPPAELQPLRLEFFGDEIDTMRRFDPATQRTYPGGSDGAPVPDRILVTPAREYLLSDDTASQQPSSATSGENPAWQSDLNTAEPALANQEISEFHIPLLHPTPASLIDYLPRGALILIDDLEALEESIAEVEEQAVKTRRETIDSQILPEDYRARSQRSGCP